MKTISDLIATRRDTLKFGTFGLLGAFGETALWPHKVRRRRQIEP